MMMLGLILQAKADWELSNRRKCVAIHVSPEICSNVRSGLPRGHDPDAPMLVESITQWGRRNTGVDWIEDENLDDMEFYFQ